jgi:tRNA (guanine26-N2/guanine27-N2)-dimethyltransferase
MHEAGLRILIGLIVRHAARYDKAARPILSHATDHYMRTYISLEKGARKAEASLDQMGHTLLHADGRFQTVTLEEDTNIVPGPAPRRETGTLYWGPLWAGPLHELSHLRKMKIPDAVKKKARLEKAIEIWKDEADLGPMFYDVDELSSRLRSGPPRMDRLLSAIHDEGYKAVRTQFSPKGFKTDMAHAELIEILKHI